MSRAALVAAIALTLAACSSGGSSSDADELTVSDAWAKAADSGMTAAFGTITNDSDHDITLTGASSDAAAEVQLHEVVNDTMRQVDGGLVVPAHGTLTLQPGGYHLMFMSLPHPILAGDEVEVTLETRDGSTLTFTAVAKDFTGANEDYDGGMDMGGDAMSDGSSSEGPMSPAPTMGG